MKILITGGAGFIGSNLVEELLRDSQISLVRVLDNLSTGYYSNLEKFQKNPRFEFVKGDIRNFETCINACQGINKISHQAALGSVPRSIEDPITATEVNILGTVNILQAAIKCGVERIILAFSSSTYGDSKELPKVENTIGKPLSPYAITKTTIEDYARIFGEIYGLKWIGLRYFNVFGKNQMPGNPYAAVIPLFCKAALTDETLYINGDGLTSRDFTHVSNAVLMNRLALFTENKSALNEIYNCACSENTSLKNLVALISKILDKPLKVEYRKERKGDVKHSLASIEKANLLLGYTPVKYLEPGLEDTLSWISNNQ